MELSGRAHCVYLALGSTPSTENNLPEDFERWGSAFSGLILLAEILLHLQGNCVPESLLHMHEMRSHN